MEKDNDMAEQNEETDLDTPINKALAALDGVEDMFDDLSNEQAAAIVIYVSKEVEGVAARAKKMAEGFLAGQGADEDEAEQDGEQPSDTREIPAIPYSMLIQWSPEDQCYLVTLPEWTNVNAGGPHTHGATYVEAASMGQECLELCIKGAKKDNETLPIPNTVVPLSEQEIAIPPSRPFGESLADKAQYEVLKDRSLKYWVNRAKNKSYQGTPRELLAVLAVLAKEATDELEGWSPNIHGVIEWLSKSEHIITELREILERQRDAEQASDTSEFTRAINIDAVQNASVALQRMAESVRDGMDDVGKLGGTEQT
jgi:antitoxin HicB